jgi:polar amino acid transport system substrate-binding protein
VRWVALLSAVLVVSACASDPNAGTTFRPAKPGVLTVATAFLPAPGFWEGKPATSGGFEAGLAKALAGRLGLHTVRVVQVPFADITAGKLGGADIGLSQLTATKEREHHLDFTTPYLTSPPGVLARTGVEADDAAALRDLDWVVSTASSLTPIVGDTIRPAQPPMQTLDRTEALAVLRAGKADALLLDLPVALGLARAEPGRFHVVGQLGGGEGLAVALPDGSSNTEVVDSAIRHLQADGTIDSLASKWLGDETDVPLIRTEE